MLYFAALYLKISFLVGGVLGALLYIRHYGPDTQSNYNDFCSTYYRFVPDDALRTHMYDNKISQMKARLDEMGIDKRPLSRDSNGTNENENTDAAFCSVRIAMFYS